MLGTQLVIRVGRYSAMYTLCMDDTKHGIKYIKNLGKTLETAQANAKKYFDEHGFDFPLAGLEVLANTGTQFEGLDARDAMSIRKQVMPYGKHSGKSFEQIKRIDSEYVDWMRSKVDSPFLQAVAEVIDSIQLVEAEEQKPEVLTVTEEFYKSLQARILRKLDVDTIELLSSLSIQFDDNVSEDIDTEENAYDRVTKVIRK